MKVIVHQTPMNSAAAPFELDDLIVHARAEGAGDEAAIANMGHTAAAEIEHYAQVALLMKTIRVTIFEPHCGAGFALPIGPVADNAPRVVKLDGEIFLDFYFLGGLRPYIRWFPEFHLLTPSRIEIEYQAGFGADASSIPQDLSQALMDQAALHYDGRSPMSTKSLTISPHMARVAARYRGVQA